ncbi:MAG: VWA domain-containing protein [Deltaproteobacteria bacterium]|nr:MAG: VWA domain-containing protein [Deltaproteobacteria bacterium]
MTFGMPIAGTTLAAAAAVLAAGAVGAYILKMRRRRFEVPFSRLWQRVLRDTESASLWRRLKRWLSLAFQLAILGTLVFAAADPVLGSPPANAKHVVVIVDASASMKAVDAGDAASERRIDVARRRAHAVIDALGAGDAAMVVRMAGRATPLSRLTSDKAALHRAIDSIDADDTPADLRAALTLAADALADRAHPVVILVGDGAYPAEPLDDAVWEPLPPTADFTSRRLRAIELAGIDVYFVPVGTRGDNVGIVAFNVRRYLANRLSYEVFIEVQNFADRSATVELTLYSGASAVDVQTLTLDAGQRVRRLFPNLGGGDGHRLKAVVRSVRSADGQWVRDVFPLDDVAYALLPERKRQRVLLVTEDNLYLEGAMLVYDNVAVDKLSPAEYEATAAALPHYDVVVFNGVTPKRVPDDANLIYFDPSGPDSPLPVVGQIEAPRVTDAAEHHPILRWVELGDVNFDRARVFRIDRARGDVSLARSIRSTIMAAARRDGRKIAAFGFPLTGTDMVLRIAFPLLLVNTLDWMAGDDADLITTYATGKRLRVPIDVPPGATEVEVHTPSGRTLRAPVADGLATFYGAEVGVHQVVARADGQVLATVELAANLANPAESAIRPATQLQLGGRPLAAPPPFEPSRRRQLWAYLALMAVGLLSIEWFTYSRRITV